VLLVAGPVAAEAPQGRVLCFGDSMTANKKSYVSILDGRWQKATMINAGRGGRKTADRDNLTGLLERMAKADEKRVAAGGKPLKIDWVFLMLGGNDLKARADDTTVAKCVQNMGWMIDHLREKIPGVKILLLAPPNLDPKKMKENGYETQAESVRRMAELETAYRKLATEKNVRFISLLHVVPAENLSDGLHPDAAGQAMIADAIVKGFAEGEGASQPAVPAAPKPLAAETQPASQPRSQSIR
jgi:lysophospholipase L1-like esterase